MIKIMKIIETLLSTKLAYFYLFVDVRFLKSLQFLSLTRLVESKPFRFPRLNECVVVKLDQNELIKLFKILFVALKRSQQQLNHKLINKFEPEFDYLVYYKLVVDICEENAVLFVFIFLEWIVPVFGLD